MSIILLGDVMLDKTLIGTCNRIAPEGPFPIINVNNIEINLGGTGNVLNNIVDFFNTIYLITALNEKDNKQYLKPLLEDKLNIIHINFSQENRKIIIKNRILADNQYICRYDEEIINNLTFDIQDKIYKYIYSIINKIDIILISDYAKGFLTDNLLFNVISLCNKHNILTLVDPKGDNYSKYINASLIKPNIKEATNYFNKINNQNNFNTLDNKDSWYLYDNHILNKLHINFSLTTLGKDGIRLSYKDASNNIQYIKKNIIPSTVIDVTGCGDTIIAAVAIYYIQNNKQLNSYENLLDTLTMIGSNAVNCRGCYMLNNQNFKIINNNKEQCINKTVFTNGCFDIVHLGHLKLLKECKKLGNKLVIGINSDASVKRLKGEKRPINSLNDRINYLKELEIADEIISFNEDTPLELIKKLKPNILVKGGDYKFENIVGHDIVPEVNIIPLVKGYSSTMVINKIY